MKVIRVPRVTSRAFDPRRKASDLLRHQVVQLEYVVGRLKGGGALVRPASTVRTEGQAASYVTDAMRLLKIAPVRPPVAAGADAPDTPPRRKPARKRTARGSAKRTARVAPKAPAARKKKVKKTTGKRAAAKRRRSR